MQDIVSVFDKTLHIISIFQNIFNSEAGIIGNSDKLLLVLNIAGIFFARYIRASG